MEFYLLPKSVSGVIRFKFRISSRLAFGRRIEDHDSSMVSKKKKKTGYDLKVAF
jgi:hypothetical protein